MRNILMLGGHGFVGYYVMKELIKQSYKIKSIVRKMPEPKEQFKGVEYVVGDVFDEELVRDSLEGIDTVFYFISTSMPNSGAKDLANEIDITLKALEHVMRSMAIMGVKRIVFPSSGGAIYGDTSNSLVNESSTLYPTTAYGVGKQLSESIIQFYCVKYGFTAYVFRIGNVYGSKQLRRKPQGVIDVFVQSALMDDPISIWGDASKSIRDYVFLEDVAHAIVKTSDLKLAGINIFNVGTGIGTSVEDIVRIIENKLNKKLIINHKPQKTSGVSRIVLDCSKIQKLAGWTPEVNLEKGIELTIIEKMHLLEKMKKDI